MEVHHNIAMVFQRQRPAVVSENSETTVIEADATVVLDGPVSELRLGSGAFTGCRLVLINNTNHSVSLLGNDQVTEIKPYKMLELFWFGSRSTWASMYDFENQVTVPLGTVITCSDRKNKSGYLYANGSAFFPELYPEFYELWKTYKLGYDHFGMPRLPDLRGVVFRMADDGIGFSTQQKVFQFEPDAIRNITGQFDAQGYDAWKSDYGAFVVAAYGYVDGGTSGSGSFARDRRFDASRVVPVAHENRVKSKAVYPFIKVL
ncbi:hypothetical protein [Breznakiella homolactica]|uniref:Uncharacterized protein n=1 Tax=Breznakiella homolactica TaxID=2798577 RepID=A0A7T8BBJ3_9SPIR|nr:hypothetical protein [Breznakiella homolactica]QQO10100.1 hypothetical protein JFL75_04055 [Breznakiella homolactica]